MSLDLAAVENALHAWAATALGLQAIWSHSNAAAPATPYGWLTLAGPVGTTNAQVIDETNLANPAGQEIEQTVIQHEEWAFSIEVISGQTSGAGSARSLLAASALRLQLPSAIDAVRAAGLAVIDVGDTQDLTALFGTKFESRARLTARLRTVNTATEKTGFIERVGASSPFGAWPQLPP
jgi:hypothetical protein